MNIGQNILIWGELLIKEQGFPFVILVIALIFRKAINEKIRGEKRAAVAAKNVEISKNLPSWMLVIVTIALVWATLQLANYEKHRTAPYMDVKIKNIIFENKNFIPIITIRNLSDGYVPDVYCGIRIIVTDNGTVAKDNFTEGVFSDLIKNGYINNDGDILNKFKELTDNSGMDLDGAYTEQKRAIYAVLQQAQSKGIKRRYGKNSKGDKWAKNLEEIVNGETYAPKEENNPPIRLYRYNPKTIDNIINEKWDFHILVQMIYQDKISKKKKYYYADYYCDHNWKMKDPTATTYTMRLKSPPIRTRSGEEELWNKDQESWQNQEE